MRKYLLATAAGFAALVANGVTPAHAQSAAEVSGQVPAPGLTLTTTARLRFHTAFISQDGDATDAGASLGNFDFNTYGRVRFDLTGRSEAGLIYGGRLEIRHLVQAGAPGPTASTPLIFRVANGFIGTPTLGQLRFGTNGVLAVPMMFTGHIMGRVGTGLLDGDVGDFFYTGQDGVLATNFWYSATGNVNRATGIGYYSPSFAGFDFGISFAPSEYGFLGGCNVAGGLIGQCDRADTVLANADHQIRNIIDAMIRYRGTFGGVGVALSGGLRTAQATDAAGAATSRRNPTVGVIGGEVTFAGFTLGGITTFGSANRGFASGATMLPSTGNNDSMFSWQIGAMYTVGAITVGAAYHELRSEGALAQAANLRERGLGIGGSYALAPGLAVFAEYVWSRVNETGRDFDNGRAGVQDRFTAQAFMLGIGMGF